MMITERIKKRTRRERRAVALAMLAVVSVGAQAAWRAEARATIDSRRELAAQEPALRASLAALEQSPLWTKFRRAEPSFDPSLELERTIQTARAAAELTIRATERLPTAPLGSVTRYGVTVRATARVKQLNAFLSELRSASPHLRVENLRVAVPMMGAGTATDELDVSIDVVGYLLPATPSAAGA
jgi:type II secretion system (T2SS) protein M